MSPSSAPDETLPDNTDIAAVSALEVPLRNRLYEYVCRENQPASRDDASHALGIARQTAAFHLDKLADVGLLEVEFARRSGRRGPGAGRPAKLYRRANRDIAVQLPRRSYELAGQLLAHALHDTEHTGRHPRESLRQHACELGNTIGVDTGPSEAQLVASLARCGYEPRVEKDEIALLNCPFRSLANRHTDLVCGMNLDLVSSILGGAAHDQQRARLAPCEHHCCVRISRTS